MPQDIGVCAYFNLSFAETDSFRCSTRRPPKIEPVVIHIGVLACNGYVLFSVWRFLVNRQITMALSFRSATIATGRSTEQPSVTRNLALGGISYSNYEFAQSHHKFRGGNLIIMGPLSLITRDACIYLVPRHLQSVAGPTAPVPPRPQRIANGAARNQVPASLRNQGSRPHGGQLPHEIYGAIGQIHSWNTIPPSARLQSLKVAPCCRPSSYGRRIGRRGPWLFACYQKTPDREKHVPRSDQYSDVNYNWLVGHYRVLHSGSYQFPRKTD